MDWTMVISIAAAGLFAGLIVSAGFMQLVRRVEKATLNAKIDASDEKADDLYGKLTLSEADVVILNEEIKKLTMERSTYLLSQEFESRARKSEVEALTTIRGEIEKDLKNLASDALQSNQKSFMEIANQVLDKHKESASGDLEKRQESIKNLLQPISSTLKEYQEKLNIAEKERHESYGNLSEELKTVIQTQTEVRTETSKLVNALRAAPKTRGRWGEETLTRVMELSGMSQHCDFDKEKSFNTEDGRRRPDVIIHLPGDRSIVVDAKTSTSAYLDAFEATDDADREKFLIAHAKQIRTHVGQLSSKSYRDSLDLTPDFVAMFIPGENFFAAAMEHDHDLFQYAFDKGVIIVTPMTLIALTKSVALGWRQEKVAENAKQVAELGRDLYKRLATMGSHVVDLGSSIKNTTEKYNKFVGSLERQVMPQARKFTELDIEDAGKVLDSINLLEAETRPVRTDLDLEFLGDGEKNIKQLEPRE